MPRFNDFIRYYNQALKFMALILIIRIINKPAFGSPTNIAIAKDRTVENQCITFDLSYQFDEKTIYWIGMKPFRFSRKIINDPQNGGEGTIFYTANEFEAAEHGGTHLDAPYHFNKNGWKVGEIPIDHLAFVDGIVINAKNEAELDNDYALKVDKLIQMEKNLKSPITRPTVIILNFGWARKFSNKNDYYGSKELNITDLHFPGISKEAAEWIAKHEKIVGVGLDTPSADSGRNSAEVPAHIAINGANKFILENLALEKAYLPEAEKIKLTVSPMKIKEGSGAPCRIFAQLYTC